jgi:hypothetical protein
MCQSAPDFQEENLMNSTVDLERYRYRSYLELCLVLVQEALKDCEKGNYDLVNTQLSDILETFERDEINLEAEVSKKNILQFPLSR